MAMSCKLFNIKYVAEKCDSIIAKAMPILRTAPDKYPELQLREYVRNYAREEHLDMENENGYFEHIKAMCGVNRCRVIDDNYDPKDMIFLIQDTYWKCAQMFFEKENWITPQVFNKLIWVSVVSEILNHYKMKCMDNLDYGFEVGEFYLNLSMAVKKDIKELEEHILFVNEKFIKSSFTNLLAYWLFCNKCDPKEFYNVTVEKKKNGSVVVYNADGETITKDKMFLSNGTLLNSTDILVVTSYGLTNGYVEVESTIGSFWFSAKEVMRSREYTRKLSARIANARKLRKFVEYAQNYGYLLDCKSNDNHIIFERVIKELAKEVGAEFRTTSCAYSTFTTSLKNSKQKVASLEEHLTAESALIGEAESAKFVELNDRLLESADPKKLLNALRDYRESYNKFILDSYENAEVLGLVTE